MHYQVPDIWLGDERSYLHLADASTYLLQNPGLDPKTLLQGAYPDDDDDEEEDDLTRMMRRLADAISFKVGTVGVIEVSGTLVDETGYFNPWFDLISYDTLVYAARQFADDEDVTSTLILWSTPGGSASGIDAAGAALKDMGKEKPINSFVKTQASSAGYWLAAETNKIYGSRMAELGSIGAVISYTSIFRMLKERGVDTEIIRAGKEKALGHPREPISDKAKAILKKKVDTFYGFFIQHVAERRPVVLDKQDDWAEGKVFFMEEGVSLGLADGIISLEQLLGKLDQSQAGPGGPSSLNYAAISQTVLLRGGPSMAKELKLTDEQQAALGRPPADTTDGTPPAEATDGTPPAEATDGTPPAEATDGTPRDGEAPADDEEGATQMVAFMRDELKEAMTSNATLTSQLNAAQAKAEGTQATVDLLMPIVKAAARDMQVRIGQSPVDMEAFSPDQAAQFYAATKTKFEERFPVGQQSLSEEEVKLQEVTPAQLGLHAVDEKGK